MADLSFWISGQLLDCWLKKGSVVGGQPCARIGFVKWGKMRPSGTPRANLVRQIKMSAELEALTFFVDFEKFPSALDFAKGTENDFYNIPPENKMVSAANLL